jgi:molecular chaperone GrpE (heat shock protein)
MKKQSCNNETQTIFECQNKNCKLKKDQLEFQNRELKERLDRLEKDLANERKNIKHYQEQIEILRSQNNMGYLNRIRTLNIYITP